MSVTIDLSGKRVLVVGGSAGIGRSLAIASSVAGATVAIVGRSKEKLDEVSASSERITAISADIRDPELCAGLVVEAVDALGGLDAVVVASAASPLALLESASAEVWNDVMTTNTIAPALIAQAALEHLAPAAVVAFISSIVVGLRHQGFAAYAASKAALDRTVRSWSMERPEFRFVKLAVGDTSGTDFTRDFDAALAAQLFPKWLASGSIHQEHMEVDDLGRTIAELVAVLLAHPGLTMPELTISPPGPMMALDDEAVSSMLEQTVGDTSV